MNGPRSGSQASWPALAGLATRDYCSAASIILISAGASLCRAVGSALVESHSFKSSAAIVRAIDALGSSGWRAAVIASIERSVEASSRAEPRNATRDSGR